MWGDPEAALQLQASDPLASLLFQITGPAHIPWQDPRWQELLHGYNVWVHLEARGDAGLVSQACGSLTAHAPQSSNLAALSLHVTRMIQELTIPTTGAGASPTASTVATTASTPPHLATTASSSVTEFSSRIAMVGKARATAGALNLLRILAHAVLVHASSTTTTVGDGSAYVQECFTYKSRDNHQEIDSGSDLLLAILAYVASNPSLTSTVPELYDATVLMMELLLVLLSSQLYEPMISSFQRRDEAEEDEDDASSRTVFWKCLTQSPTTTMPRQLLLVLLEWMVQRPPAPARSIAIHHAELANSVVKAKGEVLGKDGMYESHLVVTAYAPDTPGSHDNTNGTTSTALTSSSASGLSSTALSRRHSSNILLDATKGVLVLSSSIILLPFRLMSLALGLWGHSKEKGYDQAHKQRFLQQSMSHLTKDVMWLSDSMVADLASCFLLLLVHNDRAGSNPYRDELTQLTDNRWETGEALGSGGGRGLPDLPDLPALNGGGALHEDDEAAPLVALSVPPPLPPTPRRSSSGQRLSDHLTFNFESLFESFGRTAHTEVGAVLLYSLMQTSQAFADSIAVRSDLDTLVLPLLRTLYFSSALRHYAAHDYASRRGSQPQQSPQQQRRPSNESFSSTSTNTGGTAVSIRNCPFRSQSQLYVIIILLLLFSQDPSFGTDAFRRVHVSTVVWYKERYLKDINLGSILLLCILRSLTFNLNRLRDSFLLSNCCAILMNLSPNITDLHEYAAMRLVAIAMASMKRYMALRIRHPDHDDPDGDDYLATPTAMHGEVCRTLLRVIKASLSSKNVERNLNLVYALVYHQADWKKQTGSTDSPFKKSEVDRIHQVIATASNVIESSGDARTAAKALKVLADHMDQIREVVTDKRRREADAFTFTYEEEADPETFFVPYVWEVIVCAATASVLEWDKCKILVFPLLEDPSAEHPVEPPMAVESSSTSPPNMHRNYSKDVSDLV